MTLDPAIELRVLEWATGCTSFFTYELSREELQAARSLFVDGHIRFERRNNRYTFGTTPDTQDRWHEVRAILRAAERAQTYADQASF